MKVLIEHFPSVRNRKRVIGKTVDTSIEGWEDGLSSTELDAVVFSLELEEPFNIRGVLASPVPKED
jgi:hypothetical protein